MIGLPELVETVSAIVAQFKRKPKCHVCRDTGKVIHLLSPRISPMVKFVDRPCPYCRAGERRAA